MSKRLQLFAVGLPIVLLVVMIGRAEWQLAHSETWHFAIQGYDPRDLLRGHYMRFSLDVAVDETLAACRVGDEDCCYCLSEGNGIEPHVAVATCTVARDRCDAFVNTRALHALTRFYIPEQGRLEMERALRVGAALDRAHLAVAVSDAGDPMIEALLIDGVPIEAAVGVAVESEARND